MQFRQFVLAGMLSLAASAFSQAADSAAQGTAHHDIRLPGTLASGYPSNINRPAQVSGEDAQKAIEHVQAKLKKQGFFIGQADGVWTQTDSKALRNYQLYKDLDPAGVMNPKTADQMGLNEAEFSAFEAGMAQQIPGAECRPGPCNRHTIDAKPPG